MRRSRTVALICGICCLAPLPGLAQVGMEFLTMSGTNVINLDGPVPASWIYMGLSWAAPAYSKSGGAVNSLQCLATGRNRGELKRGMSLALEGRIYSLDGQTTLKELSRKSRPFNPAARFSWSFPDVSADHDSVGIILEGPLSGTQQLDFVKLVCRVISRMRCQNDSQTLCLVGNNRFKVQLDFGSGQGRVAARAPRSGLFTVASPSRADVVVELFDKCRTNDHFWVGIGSTTPVSFDVVVEDTLSGETRSFSNPGTGMARVHTDAFPTCP